VDRQNIQCRVGFAMMSPSAISFLLRTLGRKGKLARKQVGDNYLIAALADCRDCGSRVTCLIDQEVACAMSTQRGATLGS
jgi:hypothetical protein